MCAALYPTNDELYCFGLTETDASSVHYVQCSLLSHLTEAEVTLKGKKSFFQKHQFKKKKKEKKNDDQVYPSYHS